MTEGNYLGKYNEDVINLAIKTRDSWPEHTLGSLSYVYLVQENPMTVASTDRSVDYNEVMGAAKSVSPFSASGAAGPVTYRDAGSSKCLTVAKDGKVQVAKGTALGTYTAKAAGYELAYSATKGTGGK